MVFGDRKSSASNKGRQGASAKDVGVTILTAGCHFEGKFYCQGASRIGGRIDGEIVSEGLLIIEEGAVVTAKILADEAIVQGTVYGEIRIKKKIELASTCKVKGNIIAPCLNIQEGAILNGTTTMGTENNGVLEPFKEVDLEEDLSVHSEESIGEPDLKITP